VPMSINNHDFAYPVHTTTPGCSNNIRYQIRNTGLIDNNYTINCQGLINGNRLELQQQQQQQQQQPIVVPNNNDIGNRNYNQHEKYGENLNQIAIQSRFSDSNQQQFAQTTISTG
ncbi:unnamed protein product, partial [Onchocerca ochengi]|uniref:ZP domain-containing protein n=1 Tax=Onchocerca ochengi TaxID=42157 RepID=A0A182EUD4_ONCOC